MTLSDPASATAVAMVETTYDALGNLLALERGAAELSSASEGSTSASFVAGQTTRRELLYDSLGRRKRRLEAWGVRLEIDGTQRSARNRNGTDQTSFTVYPS
jgi:hypothetical protein